MAEKERCDEPRFTHVWLSRNKKSTWNVLSLCAVLTSDRMPVPHPELLRTLATRLPLQGTLLPTSGLISPVAHIQNTPQRPLFLFSPDISGVSPYLHTCLTDTQNLKSDDTGEVLSKPVNRSTNTRWFYQLKKRLSSKPSGGPRALSPGQLSSAPGRHPPKASAPDYQGPRLSRPREQKGSCSFHPGGEE